MPPVHLARSIPKHITLLATRRVHASHRALAATAATTTTTNNNNISNVNRTKNDSDTMHKNTPAPTSASSSATALASGEAITVSPAPTQRARAEHWTNATGTGFKNPWASWTDQTLLQVLQFGRKFGSLSAADDKRDMPRADEIVPRVKPTWGWDKPENEGRMKVTWMGHASALVEMPLDGDAGVDNQGAAGAASEAKASTSKRGVTILFDPAYSKRCSPTQYIGSVRYQQVEELPEIDIVMLSHNHYDHQDNPTLSRLFTHLKARPPLMVVPLNNTRSLPHEIPRERIVEMDWWETREVAVRGKGKVLLTCTPAQHMTARSPFDKANSLWASWAVKHVPTSASASAPSVWFGGDTGYLSTANESLAHDANLDAPHCPAFEQIGQRVGPFSAALIPIGAYGPRWFLSPVHASPAESVRIFKDVRAKHAIGIHWGTWHMAYEPVDEPPRVLADVRPHLGVTEEQFGVMAIGETRAYDA